MSAIRWTSRLVTLISSAALDRRAYWVSEIVKISGHFGSDSARVNTELNAEMAEYGLASLLDHLRLCGTIPESYGQDTSEEKLYSKYTDSVVALALSAIGLRSLVLTERADAADVEAYARDYSLVADAKAFRLSRTAKNQKDFKIQALDTWRRERTFAMVVAPLYQLPGRSSQIYLQAIARNVCVFSFSHLAVLAQLASEEPEKALTVLKTVLESVEALPPTKDAVSYWTSVNGQFINNGDRLRELWRIEKAATLESLEAAKREALSFLDSERERIMRLSHTEALRQLVTMHKIESRVLVIERVADPIIMDIGL